MVTLLIKLFAIAIFDVLINCEFPLTHCSLPQATLSLVASPSIFFKEYVAYTTAIRHFIVTWQAPRF